MDMDTKMFNRLVTDDVRRQATPEGSALLRQPENWLDWQADLEALRRQVNSHIANDKLSLAELKPTSGTHPSEEYLQAKAEADLKLRSRLRFLRAVNERHDEVSRLIRDAGVLNPTKLLSSMVRASMALEAGDTDAAFTILEAALDRSQELLAV